MHVYKFSALVTFAFCFIIFHFARKTVNPCFKFVIIIWFRGRRSRVHIHTYTLQLDTRERRRTIRETQARIICYFIISSSMYFPPAPLWSTSPFVNLLDNRPCILFYTPCHVAALRALSLFTYMSLPLPVPR